MVKTTGTLVGPGIGAGCLGESESPDEGSAHSVTVESVGELEAVRNDRVVYRA